MTAPRGRGPRPAFIVGRDVGRSEEVALGIKWLFEVGADDEDRVLIAPTKSQYFSGHLAEVLRTAGPALASGRSVGSDRGGRTIRGATQQTFRRLSWRGGPVLLLWPESRVLSEIDDDPKASAICVVPWNYENVATWAEGRSAIDLKSPGAKVSASQIADPVVEQAMMSLTSLVNLRTGLVHPRDKASAVQAFRILKRGSHEWEPTAIEAWVMAHGWTMKGAAELRQVAEGVRMGRRFQLRARPVWKSQILRQWRADARRG